MLNDLPESPRKYNPYLPAGLTQPAIERRQMSHSIFESHPLICSRTYDSRAVLIEIPRGKRLDTFDHLGQVRVEHVLAFFCAFHSRFVLVQIGIKLNVRLNRRATKRKARSS